ncbi:MAG: CHASE2 domain-containing protein [Verrucomicrobiota bacterium]
MLSLMTHGWPWPREIYAALLDRLSDAGAKLVIFDILFTSKTDADPILKASLDRHADKVIVGCNFTERNGEDVLALPSSSLVPQAMPPDPRTAFVNFWQDPDGVFRRARFHHTYIGAAIGEVESKVEIDSIAAKAAERLGQGKLVPPGDTNYLFRYTDLSGYYQPISVYQVFDPQSWAQNFGNGSFFKDKIVMVGPSANFHQDEHMTPFILHLRDPASGLDRQSHNMDGAEIHLQALNALLHQEFLFYSGESLSWMILLVIVNGVAAWVLLVTVYRAATFCALALAFYAIYFGLAYSMFSQGFILAVGAPLGTFFRQQRWWAFPRSTSWSRSSARAPAARWSNTSRATWPGSCSTTRRSTTRAWWPPARDRGALQRPARLHRDDGECRLRTARQPAQRILHRDDQAALRAQGHSRQIHRRCGDGDVGQLQSRAGDRLGQRGARGAGDGRGARGTQCAAARARPARAGHGHRHPSRRGGRRRHRHGRQQRHRGPQEFHRHRRHGEPGLSAGGRDQGVRRRAGDQRDGGAARAAALSPPGPRLRGGEGPAEAGGHLHRAGREGPAAAGRPGGLPGAVARRR